MAVSRKVQGEVNQWQAHLELAKQYRERYGMEHKWDRWRKYYRNEYSDSTIPVNMIFATGRSLIPRIYFRNPKIMVTPDQPGFFFHAKLVEAIDNKLVRLTGMKDQLKRSALNAFLYGTGVGKVGYDSEFGFIDDDDSRQQVAEMETLVGQEIDEPSIEYDANIIPGHPWFKSLHPRDLYVPWGTLEIKDSPWAAHRFVRHIDDVRADRKYVNASKVSPTHRTKSLSRDYEGVGNALDATPDAEYVELFEIHDLREGRIKVIATGYEGYLRNDPMPINMNKLPFHALIWNEDTDGFWGLSDCQMIEPQQLELNEIRTQFQEHRKRSLLKVIMRRGAFSPEDKDKLISGDVGPLLEADVDGSLRDAITTFQPFLGTDLITAGDVVRQDIREQVGFSRNQMGEYDVRSRRTATEAAIVDQAAQIRVDERRDALADMYMEVIEDFNRYIFEFWDEQQVAEIVGPDGRQHWVSFTGQQLHGRYSLTVDPEEAQPRSAAQRKMEAHELLQMLAQFPPEMVNHNELLRDLGGMYDWVDVNRIMNVQEVPGGQPVVPIEQLQAEGGMPGPGGGGGGASMSAMMELLGGMGQR